MTGVKDVQRAVRTYGKAVQAHRDAKRSLQTVLRDARADGHSAQELADAAGCSRQRIYQLLSEGGR